MPAADSAAFVVARFLKAGHFTASYDAFISEAGLPKDAGNLSNGALTLEKLLEEKKMFDLSLQFEKTEVAEEGAARWTAEAPSTGHELTSVLTSKSNVLSVNLSPLIINGSVTQQSLLVSSADRKVHQIDLTSSTLENTMVDLQDSPILSTAVFRGNVLLTTSMSGRVLASDMDGTVLDQRNDHAKYVVQVAIHDDTERALIATAAWDNKVIVYAPKMEPQFQLNEPIATVSLPSRPYSIAFLRHPEDSKPILLISRADSSNLFYYTVEPEPRLLGKQDLAPYSNAWVAFTPSSLAISPVDSSLVAVGTSSIPHMKLLIVRLLVPSYTTEPLSMTNPPNSSLMFTPGTETATAAAQTRAMVAVQEKEAAAILIHCTTMAPQTAYSTPAVAWRPDGSGIWVNGDDGAIRGIEASTGKVVCTLSGHDEGSKVRCLWAGNIHLSGDAIQKEVLVSGGFDQKLILWRR